MKNSQKWPFFGALIILAIGVAIFFIQRVSNDYQCPVREHAGIQCPGCGGTRAINSLLAGDIEKAFRQNALIVTSSLIGIGLLLVYAYRVLVRKQKGITVHPKAWMVVLAVVIIFTVWRNL